MIETVIYGLSNDLYHRGEPYNEYLSSTQLKAYAKSPKFAKFMIDNPPVETEAMRFGTLFHDCMAALTVKNGKLQGLDDWRNGIAVFEPPENPKTGAPFGSATNKYKEAYANFLQTNEGKLIAPKEDIETVMCMVEALTNGHSATSKQVLKLLEWGKPEVSIFYETEDGIKLKIRPDRLTDRKIVDWKSIALDDLTEESINRVILRYGYHISAAMYQYVAKQVFGKWYDFLLVFAQKQPPYDCVMVDMSHGVQDLFTGQPLCYGFHYDKDTDTLDIGVGAREFDNLLQLHTKCKKTNEYPGAEAFIPGDMYRIMEIVPPRYYQSKFTEEY